MFSMRTLLPILGFVFLTTDSSSLPPSRETIHYAATEESFVATGCYPDVMSCWEEGKLLHSTGRCYPPLTQGPCADGLWWVLDLNITQPGVPGKCVALSCPPDRRSAECRRRMREFAETCPRLPSGDAQFAVHFNPMGGFRCGTTPGRVQSLHRFILCIPREQDQSMAVSTSGVHCAQDDDGNCGRSVEGSQRNLTLISEDC